MAQSKFNCGWQKDTLLSTATYTNHIGKTLTLSAPLDDYAVTKIVVYGTAITSQQKCPLSLNTLYDNPGVVPAPISINGTNGWVRFNISGTSLTVQASSFSQLCVAAVYGLKIITTN